MSVATTKLGANLALGVGQVTLYTVPAGKRAIVKSVVVQNLNAAAAHTTLKGYNGATQLWQYAIWQTAVNTNGDSVISLPWIVMNAGETLQAVHSAASAAVVVSGTELTL